MGLTDKSTRQLPIIQDRSRWSTEIPRITSIHHFTDVSAHDFASSTLFTSWVEQESTAHGTCVLALATAPENAIDTREIAPVPLNWDGSTTGGNY
ncbi:hypothetical protein PIIN_10117 [Serendipita indica DSM 11827]|uniref:Uncharacterized protein n=1 Tax=Serendipita indica (strain DSM 11827) TaxID=1109443 RepID=G4TXS4_SERID|nr:hypothetical protein PIIN_10117 [Serendipita indica DSM 11827]